MISDDINQLRFDIVPPDSGGGGGKKEEECEEGDKPVKFQKFSDKILEVKKKCWGCENGFYYTKDSEEIHDLFSLYIENKGKLSENALAKHIYRWHKANIYNNKEDDTPMEKRKKWGVRSIKRHIRLHMSDEFTTTYNTLEDLRVFKLVCKNTVIRSKKKKKDLDSEFLKQYILLIDKESKLIDKTKTF